jgi:hypothetical protein
VGYEAFEPIELPVEAWADPVVRRYCAAADGPGLLRYFIQRYGLGQGHIGRLAGLEAAAISKTVNGRSGPIRDILKWRRIADALDMPAVNRALVMGADDALPLAAAQPAPVTEAVGRTVDFVAWLGARVAGLFAVVDTWHGHDEDPDGLQGLIHQEVLMFDSADVGDAAGPTFAASRRQALMSLAALPLAFAFTPAASNATAEGERERFVARCAASITACWHLLRSNDIQAVDTVVSGYLVRLDGVARQPSRHRRAAAVLASQAHYIAGIVAMHRDRNLATRHRHNQQAVYYARLSGDPRTEAEALHVLGNDLILRNTIGGPNDPAVAQATYARIDSFTGLTPLQRSKHHAFMALVAARMAREDDAIEGVARAESLFPDQPEQDDAFVYAEYSAGSRFLTEGRTFLALAEHYPDRDYAQHAARTFAYVQDLGGTSTPSRILAEISNYRAHAATLLNDLDAVEFHLNDSIERALSLRSQLRLAEAQGAWRDAATRWPVETRVKQLGDHLRTARQRQLSPQ